MQLHKLHSYRATIERGEHDPAEPLARVERIGLKAASAQQAAELAHAVTGGRVVDVYRQERGQ